MKTSVIPNHEKHFQRGALSDIRSPLKKSGAGNGNWGVLGEEILDEEIYRFAPSKSDLSHIKVIEAEEFSRLKSAVSLA
ncbi:2372_t:CDS:2 [Diversispora eburnea]|uniref:2372_t:CDS:1 n=1 Tax=Diversispora eburnea TaxID=1213867 RepID=A0A9N8V216_9GLOM|nr:2372_t:CDS:2 [Diversispora eburnea]